MEREQPAAMREAVARGLRARPRILPPKFFYDARGSELFEEITRQPEYYPNAAERRVLESSVAGWLRELAPGSLVELGAGSAEKTRVLIEAMLQAGEAGREAAVRPVYAPVDVSASFLQATAERLASDYPALDVVPVVADLTRDFHIPGELPEPTVIAFLGGTIGNFGRADAAALLQRVGRAMRPADRLLLGVDLKKDAARLNAAYNDAAGATAEFNRNVLRVLNRELDADFDVDAFEHRAFYDPVQGRIEMHLVATRDVTARIPDVGTFDFEEGESILTEISRKYDRAEIDETLADAALRVEHWFESAPGEYAVVVAAPG